jgi:hypothetical protein
VYNPPSARRFFNISGDNGKAIRMFSAVLCPQIHTARLCREESLAAEGSVAETAPGVQ